MLLDHSQTTPSHHPWKNSSTKLVPGAKKIGNCWFRKSVFSPRFLPFPTALHFSWSSLILISGFYRIFILCLYSFSISVSTQMRVDGSFSLSVFLCYFPRYPPYELCDCFKQSCHGTDNTNNTGFLYSWIRRLVTSAAWASDILP